MKKLTLILLVLLAAPALATDFTVSTTADAALAKGLARENAKVCQYYGLAVGCSQKAAREQFCRRAGFGGVTTCVPGANPGDPQVCTTTPLVSTCAGATQVDVHANASDYVKWLFKADVERIKAENRAASAAKVEAAKAGTQAQKDALCAAMGEPAGCLD
jgi:hypothetical protein